jgi:hypothetical protein
VDIVEWPPGTLLGEMFLEGGVQLPSGRLLFTTIGYEADLPIRENPRQPAGFNERTLFLTASGSIVSIIRGREGLGHGYTPKLQRVLRARLRVV